MNATSLKAAAASLALSAVVATPALAHHSFAMFDQARTIQVSGVVMDFQWTNPHVVVWVTANPKPGETPDVWTMELTSPGNLTRMGWTRHTLKPGDQVVVALNPLRDGKHGGSLRQVTLVSTGQVISAGSLGVLAKPGA